MATRQDRGKRHLLNDPAFAQRPSLGGAELFARLIELSDVCDTCSSAKFTEYRDAVPHALFFLLQNDDTFFSSLLGPGQSRAGRENLKFILSGTRKTTHGYLG